MHGIRYDSGNTSLRLHFNRDMICCSPRNVILCWHCSKRWSVEGGKPTFLENAVKVILPRRWRRKTLSWLSSE